MNEMYINNIQIEYELAGEGRSIVFVSGLDMGIKAWSYFYIRKLLELGFQTLSYNSRGTSRDHLLQDQFGIELLVDDCIKLVDSLELTNITLIGVSMGALIAEEMSLKRPDLVSKLCLIATWGRRTAWLKALHEGESEIYNNLSNIPVNYLVAMDMLQFFGQEALLDDARVVKQAENMRKNMDYLCEGRRLLFNAIANYDNRLGNLMGIQAECLVIAFEKDILAPPMLGKEVAKAIKGSKYVEIPNAAHSAIYEQKEKVLEHIIRFMR